uniref:mannose-6-phosphate isomerase n=1 Tax=Heterorhabditis bacteriophora TaxID=37862 RepID=A0A1I7XUZ2_HETBA
MRIVEDDAFLSVSIAKQKEVDSDEEKDDLEIIKEIQKKVFVKQKAAEAPKFRCAFVPVEDEKPSSQLRQVHESCLDSATQPRSLQGNCSPPRRTRHDSDSNKDHSPSKARAIHGKGYDSGLLNFITYKCPFRLITGYNFLLDCSPPRRTRHDSDSNKDHSPSRARPIRGKRYDSGLLNFITYKCPFRLITGYNFLLDCSPPRRTRHDSDSDRDHSPSKARAIRGKRYDSASDRLSVRKRQRHDSSQSPSRYSARKRHDSDQSPIRTKKGRKGRSQTDSGSDYSPLRIPRQIKDQKRIKKEDGELLFFLASHCIILKHANLFRWLVCNLHEILKRSQRKYGYVRQNLRKRLFVVNRSRKAPLTRTANDEQMNKYLKGVIHEDDPMSTFLLKKKKNEAIDRGELVYPQYQGECPPNRFGIRPGYRWDGVDRSNGFEGRIMFKLQCVVQNYDWGKSGFDSEVAKLIKEGGHIENIDPGKPYAELWMGVHPNGPSKIFETGEKLSTKISDNVKLVATHEQGSLQFLFKVLSVKKALSIQSHPSKEQAVLLHEKDPINYPDANHKPEMAIALTEFQLLCGFRPPEEIYSNLTGSPELLKLISEDDCDISYLNILKFGSEEEKRCLLKQLFTKIWKSPQIKISEAVTNLIERIKKGMCYILLGVLFYCSNLESIRYFDFSDKSEVSQLMIKLNDEFPGGDVGVFAPLLLNYFKLQPGEATFLGPNQPHAYLYGDCIECMACSDNTIRAGLTPKFKDIATLCDNMEYTMSGPPIFPHKDIVNGLRLYDPPVAEFAVQAIKQVMKVTETNAKKHKQKRVLNTDGQLINCGTSHKREYCGNTSTLDKAVKRALMTVIADSLRRSDEIEWVNQDIEKELTEPRFSLKESTSDTMCQDSFLVDVTDDQLKQDLMNWNILSTGGSFEVNDEDLCQRLASCLYLEKKIKSMKGPEQLIEHEQKRIVGAIGQCINVLENHDFKFTSFHLNLPTQDLDVIAEENKRMKKILTMVAFNLDPFFQRNIYNTTGVYECVFPLGTQDIHKNATLLYAIDGNYNAFFDRFNHGVSVNGDGICLPNCICMSRTSTYNVNPFHLAAAYGQTKFVKELYYPGTRVSTDLLEHYHESPLSFAVHNGNMEMVKMIHDWRLVEPTRDVPQAFREAVDQNNLPMLNYLWSFFPNSSYLLDRKSLETHPLNTPLHRAANNGNLECVKFLCKYAPEAVYLPDFCGDLPIYCAIERGHHAVINFFITKFPDSVHPTALKAAIIGNQISLAKKLFLSLVAKDIEYISPVDFAIRCRSFHLAEYFLKSYISRQLVGVTMYCQNIQIYLKNRLTLICDKCN